MNRDTASGTVGTAPIVGNGHWNGEVLQGRTRMLDGPSLLLAVAFLGVARRTPDTLRLITVRCQARFRRWFWESGYCARPLIEAPSNLSCCLFEFLATHHPHGTLSYPLLRDCSPDPTQPSEICDLSNTPSSTSTTHYGPPASTPTPRQRSTRSLHFARPSAFHRAHDDAASSPSPDQRPPASMRTHPC